MRKIFISTAIIGVFALLPGCTQTRYSNTYKSSQVQREQTIRTGVVESTRQVSIESDSSSYLGTFAGSIIGSLAGIGLAGTSRNGVLIAGIAGASLGGMTGGALQKNFAKIQGLEITVTLDDGRLISVTQDAEENFQAGDRVRLLQGSGVTRVVHFRSSNNWK